MITENTVQNFIRTCPVCFCEIRYATKKLLRRAEKGKRRCKKCADDATRQTTRSSLWRLKHSESLKKAWEDPGSVFHSQEYRHKLSVAQIARDDDRSVGAKKSAATRKANGVQEIITQKCQTPAVIEKRRQSLLARRKSNPELWQTEKAKAGWIVSGEKGKTYIDKAIAVAQSGNKRSAFERSFESLLAQLGFEPTQRVGRWWVDYMNKETMVVVECYGDWHHCHKKYDEKIREKYGGIQPDLQMSPDEKRQRDEDRLRNIESQGYTTITIWQHDSRHWLNWISSSLKAKD